MQPRERPAIADNGQPLNRAQEYAKLAHERFRTVAQQCFDYLMDLAPPLVIQSRGFRNDGRNHRAENGGVGIQRHSPSRYHVGQALSLLRPLRPPTATPSRTDDNKKRGARWPLLPNPY